MANATSALRMSGMNSGLDTEAIVNALTATTKNKINTNQRKVLKLQAQQDAYRSIISSMQKFQSKYFDMLNVGSCLKSTALFNSYKGTLSNNITGGNIVNGVTVTSDSNASPAVYDVQVHEVATQSVLKSATAEGKPVDISQCIDPSEDYQMTVTVGNKTKNITFKGGDETAVRRNINDALKSAFGVKNDGSGLVTMGDDNRFKSASKAGITTSTPTIYKDTRNSAVNVNDMKTGTNTFTVTVGNTTKTVNVSTISKDYFDEIFEPGQPKDGAHIKDGADATKVALFKQVALNKREGDVYEKFETFENAMNDDDKQDFATAYVTADHDRDINNAIEKQRNSSKGYMTRDAVKNINDNMEVNGNNVTVDGSKLTAKEKAAFDKVVADYNQKVADGDISATEGEDKYQSLKSYLENNLENEYNKSITDDEVDDYWANDAAGKLEYSALESEKERIDKIYSDRTDSFIADKQKPIHDQYFAEAKQAAYDAKVASGEISSTEGDEKYVSLENFKYTEDEFKTTSQYTSYQSEAEAIKNKYQGTYTADYNTLSESRKREYYDDNIYTPAGVGKSKEDYINAFSAADAVKEFNTANLQNNLGALVFKDEAVNIKVDVNDDGTVTVKGEGRVTGSPQKFAITQGDSNVNDFGFDKASSHSASGTGVSNQISTTQKLSSLGLTPDSNGNYNFSINGVDFSFSGDTTVKDMMKTVSASKAGVKMSYTTLTNQFMITSNEYGKGQTISFNDGGQGLLNAMGFNENSTFVEGQNTILTINNEEIETTSNSFTVDGTTFTFTAAAKGADFTNDVKRDYSKAIDVIKGFVEDYNKLIDEVYGYVDDEPNKDYYFLTDDDIDEMDLSESQQNKWEKLAKKGLLYRDQTLQSIMSKMRSVIYNSVDAPDGTKVGLYTLGITTTSNTKDHGKLQFSADLTDEQFEAKFAEYADEFATLFNDKDNGIATQFDSILDSAVKSTGDPNKRGVLVQKAGVSGTASATSNSIYNQIKSLKNMISTLQDRYEQQQDRYWKIYSNMETSLGNINGQSSYIQQLMGNM